MVRAKHPKWMTTTLKAAAIYNFAFALMTLVAPFWIFDVTGATRPNLPELWQCIGMIVGVYGIGYWIAAYDPYRHWPVVLVGWLGKTFGPLGFAKALWEGVFPIKFGWIIVFNDLIWWIPFAIMVKKAIEQIVQPEMVEITEANRKAFSAFSEDSKQKPVLVVFLRHSGCTFCREMIADLKQSSDELKKSQVSLVLVHMGLSGQILPGEWKSILDKERALYRLAGLERGTWGQVFSLSVLWRGLVAGILNGHWVGPLEGDGMMMPGAQLWVSGQLAHSWKAQSVADRLPLSEIVNKVAKA
jgi:hypothetical protein